LKEEESMRSFIGIDFSRELKSEISSLQWELKTYAISGRWKYIDNFHLTLKFLGETDMKTAGRISETMKELCGSVPKFDLKISGLGNFPGNGCLRVVWLGLGGDVDKLISFQAEIDQSLGQLGFQREKRGYSPHITMGQDVVFHTEFERIKELTGLKSFPEMTVDMVCLFKSEQIGKKRVYTVVDEFKLQG
jgi:2'-5' RNA ligase